MGQHVFPAACDRLRTTRVKYLVHCERGFEPDYCVNEVADLLVIVLVAAVKGHDCRMAISNDLSNMGRGLTSYETDKYV